jgi:hypothetical protein
MPIDNGQMLARQRALFARADQDRASLWDRIGETIQVGKASGADHRTIMKALQPVLEPLQRLTSSSGRDPAATTGELALLFAKPAPVQQAPVQSARQTVQQQTAPDFHLNDIPDAHIDAAIDRAFEGMGV